MKKSFIPVAAPHLDEKDVAAVAAAVRSGWVSSAGPAIPEFEKKFARFVGVKHAVAVSNGTVALHLALVAMGVGPGDEVIVPDLTFVATANTVAYTGAVPVMVDVLPDTWCIDPKAVEGAITKRTKAIIPVHLYGHPADMPAIMKIAKKHKLLVLEDAAEAHGAKVGGRKVGGIGHAAIFSFYGNKIITTGEGGMVTTNDARLAARMKVLRNQGAHPTRRYWYTDLGFNYRLTNPQAALGLAQLARAERFIRSKRAIATKYRRALRDVPGIQLNPEARGVRNVFWMPCLVVRTPALRAKLMRAFDKDNIESRPFFHPMSDLPFYRRSKKAVRHRTPVAHRLSACGLNLPGGVDLSAADLKRVVRAIRATLA
jgi:perosamine synthetase